MRRRCAHPRRDRSTAATTRVCPAERVSNLARRCAERRNCGIRPGSGVSAFEAHRHRRWSARRIEFAAASLKHVVAGCPAGEGSDGFRYRHRGRNVTTAASLLTACVAGLLPVPKGFRNCALCGALASWWCLVGSFNSLGSGISLLARENCDRPTAAIAPPQTICCSGWRGWRQVVSHVAEQFVTRLPSEIQHQRQSSQCPLTLQPGNRHATLRIADASGLFHPL